MSSSLFQRGGALADGKWTLWAVALSFLGLISLQLSQVFAGNLPGVDDMMRLQQVRDLLAGQNWFEVDQSRMLTPEGGAMHWSRLPDLFLAAFIFVSEPILGRALAEALATGVWPLLLLAAAFTFLVQIMRRLGVSLAGQVFGLIAFATSAAVYNFWPGRIDHHGLVVVLILAGLAAILSKDMSARSGIVLGICLTAALSIAIEALPYVAGLVAITGLFWVVRGHLEGPRLAVFGTALAVFSTLFYAFDAPGFGPQRLVCDAYGSSHWIGLLVGGGLMTVLGVFGGWLDTWPKRVAAGLMAGTFTLAIIALANPACFGDPYGAIPDTVRDSWLSAVSEARPLSALISVEPERAIAVFGLLLAVSAATAFMIVTADRDVRMARIGFALLLSLAILATVWQVRGQSFSHAFGTVAAGWFAGRLFTQWQSKGGSGPLLVFAAGALFVAPMTWQVIGSKFDTPPVPAVVGAERASCETPAPFEAMARLAPMQVHSPIDLGIPVLLRTAHKIYVGPYHRNIAGIERAIAVLIEPADAAKAHLKKMGATHLVYCIGLGETDRYGRLWPDGLAAGLNQGERPDWLVPVQLETDASSPVRLYRIENDG